MYFTYVVQFINLILLLKIYINLFKIFFKKAQYSMISKASANG